uniref:Uncharacterized protein n=1 Tax=Candidatus Methanophaga sp. ANME-1 ERB7 TaxID=2759913 RepID=A0A7G9Z9U2_9EURY|nr:hypothetical protein PEKJEAHP_00027 [Methanosarcinales archaeon ANME-1 ERB7]
MSYVHELIPVGHEGIKGGLKMMAHIGGYRIKMERGIEECLKVDIENLLIPFSLPSHTYHALLLCCFQRKNLSPFRILNRVASILALFPILCIP